MCKRAASFRPPRKLGIHAAISGFGQARSCRKAWSRLWFRGKWRITLSCGRTRDSLMTYGLVPRLVQTESGIPELRWDDLQRAMSGHRRFPAGRLYLQFGAASQRRESDGCQGVPSRLRDYQRASTRTSLFSPAIWATHARYCRRYLAKIIISRSFLGRARFLDIHISEYDKYSDRPVSVRVWGVRSLLKPADAPVSAGRWDYGSLTWPGIPEPVTQDTARQPSIYPLCLCE